MIICIDELIHHWAKICFIFFNKFYKIIHEFQNIQQNFPSNFWFNCINAFLNFIINGICILYNILHYIFHTVIKQIPSNCLNIRGKNIMFWPRFVCWDCLVKYPLKPKQKYLIIRGKNIMFWPRFFGIKNTIHN